MPAEAGQRAAYLKKVRDLRLGRGPLRGNTTELTFSPSFSQDTSTPYGKMSMTSKSRTLQKYFTSGIDNKTLNLIPKSHILSPNK